MRISAVFCRRPAVVRAGVGLAATSLVTALLAMVSPAATAASAVLVRYPYLTDLTTSSVQVTFDTTVKVTSASGAVQWGTPSGSTGCTLTGKSASSTANTVNSPITVAGATEYQTSIRITGLTAGTGYCYRIFTGGTGATDLLGSDPAPRFGTLPASGAFSFDVLGDWGDDSVAGGLNQKNVDALIAASGARFAVSTGDIAYSSGSQNNYGNLVATGSGVSEVFGPDYWTVPGAQLPLFATTGNHGRNSTFLQVWKQAATVAASGGRYAMDSYSGIDGTTAASYPSVWYAFDAGGARFYVLEADWNDSNTGTATGGPYQVDRDYHWQPTSPEYQWLQADLASHPGGLKFAFFHYPLRSDNATETGDSYLQADPNDPTSTATLEGLLANSGVDLVFNGHAHIYQRNLAPPGGVTSYVTGGGGAKVEPMSRSRCSTTDAYALGWAYTNPAGSACGAAPTPTSDAQVFHFLKVTVNGSAVTVTPTNSTGAVFDPVSYDFTPNSTAPAVPTGLAATASGSGVKLTWTASGSADTSAQDVYRNGRWLATVGRAVTSYTDAAPPAGASYTVRAHDLVGNQSGDSAPASVGGTGSSATTLASDDVTLDQTAPDAQPNPTASRVTADGSPVNDALIQFHPVLPAGCAGVTRVSLTVTVGASTDDSSVRGGDFYLTGNSAWNQAAVSWNTAPAKVGAAVFSQGTVALGQNVTVDLTGRVDVSAPVTVRIATTSGDGVRYYSREGSTTLGPRLTVTC
ncbi:MAG: DNRLRE domain-containing protein [Actinobacteria bacterium]|nr:DNRLRE domain-containing protein [Actinomycetota bacterium]